MMDGEAAVHPTPAAHIFVKAGGYTRQIFVPLDAPVSALVLPIDMPVGALGSIKCGARYLRDPDSTLAASGVTSGATLEFMGGGLPGGGLFGKSGKLGSMFGNMMGGKPKAKEGDGNPTRKWGLGRLGGKKADAPDAAPPSPGSASPKSVSPASVCIHLPSEKTGQVFSATLGGEAQPVAEAKAPVAATAANAKAPEGTAAAAGMEAEGPAAAAAVTQWRRPSTAKAAVKVADSEAPAAALAISVAEGKVALAISVAGTRALAETEAASAAAAKAA